MLKTDCYRLEKKLLKKERLSSFCFLAFLFALLLFLDPLELAQRDLPHREADLAFTGVVLIQADRHDPGADAVAFGEGFA